MAGVVSVNPKVPGETPVIAGTRVLEAGAEH